MQDGLAVLAEQLRVDRRKVTHIRSYAHTGRGRVVPLVVLEGPLSQRYLLMLVGRLVDASVVPGAQRDLITRFDWSRCGHIVHLVPAQGSLVLPPFASPVTLHVRQRVLLPLLHLVEALTLVVSRVRWYGRQALISSHVIILLVGGALPARHRASLVVWLRKLLLDTL